jgi:putative tricarboxylic transport membrane protein
MRRFVNTTDAVAMHDRVVGAVVSTLGVVMLVATRRLPPAMLGDPTGPTLLPLILSWALIGLGALLALRSATPNADAARTLASARGGAPLTAVVAILAIYTATFNMLGYLVATSLMLFFVLAIFNPGHRIQNAAVAISFSVLSYLLFHQLLGVFVPRGLVG